tara:strand:+ start:53 stop:184 length:132 start_codon:yes stop_codon:yes gene_type:complete
MEANRMQWDRSRRTEVIITREKLNDGREFIIGARVVKNKYPIM